MPFTRDQIVVILERQLDQLLQVLCAYREGEIPHTQRFLDYQSQAGKRSRLYSLPPEDNHAVINSVNSIGQDLWDLIAWDVDVIDDSLKSGIRHIGTHLDRLGGMDLMHAVLDRVVYNPFVCTRHLNPDAFIGKKMAIVDSAWDGIGGWVS